MSISLSQHKNSLLCLLQQKKSILKQLQDKCELQNKKIKLFRKQNQELKNVIDQQNQIDTNMLLNSKDMLKNNQKLEKTIDQMKGKIEEGKRLEKEGKKKNKVNNSNNQISNNDDNNNSNNNDNDNISISLSSSTPPFFLPPPSLITIKSTSITPSTLQLDLPSSQLDDIQLLPLRPFIQLTTLLLNDNHLTNQSISFICSQFIYLQRLNLANNKFTYQAFQQIYRLKQLRFLDIRNNNLSDCIMPYIGTLLKLEDFCCSKNGVTDNGIWEIKALKQLKYVDMTNNNITENSVKYFKQMNKLTHLYLMSNKLNLDAVVELVSGVGQNQLNNQKKQCKSQCNIQFLDVRFNLVKNEEKQMIKKIKSQKMEVLC